MGFATHQDMKTTILTILALTQTALAQESKPIYNAGWAECGAALAFIRGNPNGEKVEAVSFSPGVEIYLTVPQAPETTLLFTLKNVYLIKGDVAIDYRIATALANQNQKFKLDEDLALVASKNPGMTLSGDLGVKLIIGSKENKTELHAISADKAQAQAQLKSESIRLMKILPSSLQSELNGKIEASESEEEIKRWKRDVMAQYLEYSAACLTLGDPEMQTALEHSIDQTKAILN